LAIGETPQEIQFGTQLLEGAEIVVKQGTNVYFVFESKMTKMTEVNGEEEAGEAGEAVVADGFKVVIKHTKHTQEDASHQFEIISLGECK